MTQTGKVARFDSGRGYGFITPDDRGPDVFLHISELADPGAVRSLRHGARVSFTVDNSEGKGPKARAVQLLQEVSAGPDKRAPATVEGYSDVVSEQDFIAEYLKALEHPRQVAIENLVRIGRARGWIE